MGKKRGSGMRGHLRRGVSLAGGQWVPGRREMGLVDLPGLAASSALFSSSSGISGR